MAVFDDGTGPALYAGSSSGWSAGRAARRENYGYSVFKLVDGSHEALTNSPIWEIHDLEVYDDGFGPALYVAGNFTAVDEIPSRYLAKYTCSPTVDLTLSLADGVNSVRPGDLLTYKLVARNLGEVPEPAAQLANSLPAGLSCTFTSVAAGGATGNTAAGSGPLAETLVLPVGGAVTYTVRCTVPPATFHPLTHSATIGGTWTERKPANNTVADTNFAAPHLSVPVTPTAAGFLVDVPVQFTGGGHNIAATVFSLDYDATCLDPDLDDDGVLDHVDVAAPTSFTTTVLFNPLDTDGEIDISVADWNPPIGSLNDGELLSVRFLATCPATTTALDVPVVFSTSPAPSFGDDSGQAVAGTATGGVVRILPGPRGDCNGDTSLGAADLVAIGLEIFDGDGDFWLDAPSPTFAGSPVGCDANVSLVIGAADVVCTNLLLFGESCGNRTGRDEELLPFWPRLEISTSFDGSIDWIRGTLVPNGNAVGSLAFSLDLDPAHYNLSRIDMNADGIPDRLRFPAGNPDLARVSFNAEDTDGELDILLARFAWQTLHQGIVVEVGVPSSYASIRTPALANQPQPSFGAANGADLQGEVLEGTLLFGDGFESGNTDRWSSSQP